MLQTHAISYILDNRPLIREISLEFPEGLLYGILGPNGSGKSTFLKTLTGIWSHSSGHVLWQGENLLQKERREISKIMTLVPQNIQVNFEFSVREVVTMGRYPHGRGKKGQGDAVIDWALSIVDACHLRDSFVTQLSHGERQRVYIARALVTESPILLLDEPTANLDIRHQLEIWQLLRELTVQGKLIIVANHDLAATERFCDQVVVFDQGCCLGKGSFAEVVNSPILSKVFGVERGAEEGMFALSK